VSEQQAVIREGKPEIVGAASLRRQKVWIMIRP
jgi:hypothetical protein